MKVAIRVKNDFIGFHLYAGAPEDVHFLRDLHRHHFIVTTQIEVNHANREIEFFELQESIRTYVEYTYRAPELRLVPTNAIFIASCEDLAISILSHLQAVYPKRAISIEVSEDGECSALVQEEA